MYGETRRQIAIMIVLAYQMGCVMQLNPVTLGNEPMYKHMSMSAE